MIPLGRALPLAMLLLASTAVGCRPEAEPFVMPERPTEEPPLEPTGPIAPVMDGQFGEWSAGTRLLRDRPDDATGAFEVRELHATSRGSELYVHFDTTSLLNLSSGPETDGTLILSIDLPDGRTLSINFRERRIQLDGADFLSGYDIGYVASPTHAGQAFELKVDLSSLLVGPGDEVVLHMSGSDDVGPAPFVLEELASPWLLRDPLRPPDTQLRMASLNTMVAGLNTPERRDQLTRLLGAAAADIYVLQELGPTKASTIADRLAEASADDEKPWNVIVQNVGSIVGNAIASQSEIIAIAAPTPRFTAGIVQLESPGPVAVFSVHLKCCGYIGSSADETRLSEARKLRNTIEKLRAGALKDDLVPFANVPILIAGDFNDVGSPHLQDVVTGRRRGGEPLTRLQLSHLSGPHVFTWYQRGASFPPGILDLLFYSNALRPTGEFVLDSRQLDSWGLDALGLELEDSEASDHLLLVADFAAE